MRLLDRRDDVKAIAVGVAGNCLTTGETFFDRPLAGALLGFFAMAMRTNPPENGARANYRGTT